LRRINRMEFIMKTDLKQLPDKLEFNYEEMKAEFSKKLVHYNTLVVTEDSIGDAKTDKAALNKLKEAIDTRRKDVKKACLAPYEAFEKQCKEITSMIQQPILAIDNQIKAFGEAEQQQKWEQITEYYDAEVKELKELVPLEKIVPSKWKNKTESLESVNNAIGDTLERIRGELETISTLHSPLNNRLRTFISTITTCQKRCRNRNALKSVRNRSKKWKDRKKNVESRQRRRNARDRKNSREQRRTFLNQLLKQKKNLLFRRLLKTPLQPLQLLPLRSLLSIQRHLK